MPTKHCKACDQVKPREGFYLHPKMADGRLNHCAECVRDRVRKHRLANLDRIRAYDRARGSRSKPGYTAEYRAKHPHRRAAQVALGNAVRAGDIAPQPCLICGEHAEAHHPDYSRPLDVIWLCPAHHKQAHAMIKGTR